MVYYDDSKKFILLYENKRNCIQELHRKKKTKLDNNKISMLQFFSLYFFLFHYERKVCLNIIVKNFDKRTLYSPGSKK